MSDPDEKAARLAAQLRANLQRRKARQRAVAQGEPPASPPDEADRPGAPLPTHPEADA